MALGEAGLVRAEDQRDVGERRQSRAESLILQHLLGGVRDVVGAADDVREAHVDVIGDDAEVIGGDAVGRRRTKSSISALANSTRPKTASSKPVDPPSGTAKRTAEASPAALRWAAMAGSMVRQRRSYMGGRPAADACARRCSSSALVQKQG